MAKRCEICDRDVSRVHGRHCTGRGWLVMFYPRLRAPVFRPDALPDPDPACEVFTCGDEICIWRAGHHGVPGAMYERAAA